MPEGGDGCNRAAALSAPEPRSEDRLPAWIADDRRATDAGADDRQPDRHHRIAVGTDLERRAGRDAAVVELKLDPIWLAARQPERVQQRRRSCRMPQEVSTRAAARAPLESGNPKSGHGGEVGERPFRRPAEQAVDLRVAAVDTAQQARDARLRGGQLRLEPGPVARGDGQRRSRLRRVGTRGLERPRERVATGRSRRPCALGGDQPRLRALALRALLGLPVRKIADRPPNEHGERDGQQGGRRRREPPGPRQATLPAVARATDRKPKEQRQAILAARREMRANFRCGFLLELARGVGRQRRAQLVMRHAARAYRAPPSDTRAFVRVFPRRVDSFPFEFDAHRALLWRAWGSENQWRRTAASIIEASKGSRTPSSTDGRSSATPG